MRIGMGKLFSYLALLALSGQIPGCGSQGNETSSLGRGLPGDFSRRESQLLRLADEGLHYSGEMGASYALRSDGGELWAHASGLANRTTQEALTPEIPFSIGSNTKFVMAIASLKLAERGEFYLDDPIEKWLPQWNLWHGITVRQLLGMRSGIPEYLRSPWIQAAIALQPGRRFTPDELLRFAHHEPADFAPGTSCEYNNTNYILVGKIIERITGRPAAQLVDELVVRPLGLSSTYLRDAADGEGEGVARGYMQVRLTVASLGLPDFFLRLIPRKRFLGDDVADMTGYINPSIEWTTGGMISTPSEMARVVQALFHGELLGPKVFSQMVETHPCSILGAPFDYGLGIYRRDTPFGPAWGHGGITNGYRTETRYFPRAGVSYSHMHNNYPSQDEPLEDELLGVISGEVRQDDERECSGELPALQSPFVPSLQFRFRGSTLPQLKRGVGWIRGSSKGAGGILSGEVIRLLEEPRAWKLVSEVPPLPGESASRRTEIFFSKNSDDVSAVVYRIVADKSEKSTRRECVVAVSDGSFSGSFCGARPRELRAGDWFRVSGALPLETSRRAIERRERAAGRERCRVDRLGPSSL